MPWTMRNRPTGSSGRSRSPLKGRLLIVLLVAGFAVFKYVSSCEENEYTNRRTAYAWSEDQDLPIGLHAAPQLIAQHQGRLDDAQTQARVQRIGRRIVEAAGLDDPDFRFEFTVLAHDSLVNAFALPGGPVFITKALLDRLVTDGAIAGVLGHEIGHVVARHSAERAAKDQLFQGLTMAAILGTDPSNARAAQAISGLINMKYGRNQELESDELGVVYMAKAKYDPHALVRVMKVLQDASGGRGSPEFMSTHPDPGNRVGKIQEKIKEIFPDGVPEGFEE